MRTKITQVEHGGLECDAQGAVVALLKKQYPFSTRKEGKDRILTRRRVHHINKKVWAE